MVKIAGVDEAGRGCVIGPLVIAGASFSEDQNQDLLNLGVKDSKKLTPRRREELAPEIEKLATGIQYFVLYPSSIDHVVNRGIMYRKLNYLEAMTMAYIIRILAPSIAYVDPADVNIQRFVSEILRVLPEKPTIISERKADALYPSVSAASILAKVRRDHQIVELRELHGDFGSGYCSDRKTVNFLEEYFRIHKECPSWIRSSWATVKRLRKPILDKWL
jgi:ribonuclease HII